jgi:hypothetical protein
MNDEKKLYAAHTVFNDYWIVVKANNADDAQRLANEWYAGNISALDNLNIEWLIELCDNDEIVE